MARGWAGCRFCKGKKGLPRASPNSVRCTAAACTKALTRERQAARGQQEQPSEAAVPQQALESAEEMPDGMWVHELTEILGERCCRLHLLSKKRRRVGPRDSYQQEYLIRGTFLEDDGDEGEEGARFFDLSVSGPPPAPLSARAPRGRKQKHAPP